MSQQIVTSKNTTSLPFAFSVIASLPRGDGNFYDVNTIALFETEQQAEAYATRLEAIPLFDTYEGKIICIKSEHQFVFPVNELHGCERVTEDLLGESRIERSKPANASPVGHVVLGLQKSHDVKNNEKGNPDFTTFAAFKTMADAKAYALSLKSRIYPYAFIGPLYANGVVDAGSAKIIKTKPK